MSHRIFIIAGEPSGDLHGANLIEALRKIEPQIEIECWGGDRMKKAGAKIKKHIDELSFMGFVEVVKNLPRILKNFRLADQHIRSFEPDIVVLIDYPGFNLRMAPRIKKLGIPVFYYVAPQAWAWKESRVNIIRKYVNRLFVILPFEKTFFEKHGISTSYVGHPLLDEFNKLRDNGAKSYGNNKPVIAILPGSRLQEIKKILPHVVSVASSFPHYQFIVSKVAWLPSFEYERFLSAHIQLAEGHTYELLAQSTAAIVTSGTATLETAMLKVPQVVVYRANPLSVWIARRLIRIKYISLVNLILDRAAVCELIQNEVNADRLKEELNMILPGGKQRETLLKDCDQLIEKLGSGGASARVAHELLKSIA